MYSNSNSSSNVVKILFFLFSIINFISYLPICVNAEYKPSFLRTKYSHLCKRNKTTTEYNLQTSGYIKQVGISLSQDLRGTLV